MELRDYLNVISARRWVIIQAVLVVTLLAVVMGLVQPKQYAGEAKVLISERGTGSVVFGDSVSEFSNAERGLQTQVQLMQLRPLAENTVRKLGLEESPDSLLRRVSVIAMGQTNVVTIRVTAGSAPLAADIANTMAEEYVAWSRDIKRESVKVAADEVERRLGQAESDILELGRKISSQGKTDELSAELQLLTGTYATLAEKLEQLRISEQLETGTGRVVSPATVDTDPIAPQPIRNGVVGLAIGFLVGLGMAFLHEYLDNTIKSNDEAERVFGVPVLGTIPTTKFEKGAKRRLAIVESPGSSEAEAYRVLRNSLDFVNFEHKLRTLVVSSAAPAEGKSTVAANLASSLAQAGKKVVLVSCDFRKPTTEQFFDVNSVIGLSDVLLGTHSLKSALQRPMDEQLLILTSGKMPPNPSELLGSEKMKTLVHELEEWADLVIIDTPPLLAVADPAAVARWADGVVLVLRAGVSTRDASDKARELLENVGAHLVGVVAWGLDQGKSGGYGYYAGTHYYYSSYHGVQEPVTGVRGPKRAATGDPEDSDWMPAVSPGRRIAKIAGRILTVSLGFAVTIAVMAVAAYLVDQYFGWGFYQWLISVLA